MNKKIKLSLIAVTVTYMMSGCAVNNMGISAGLDLLKELVCCSKSAS